MRYYYEMKMEKNKMTEDTMIWQTLSADIARMVRQNEILKSIETFENKMKNECKNTAYSTTEEIIIYLHSMGKFKDEIVVTNSEIVACLKSNHTLDKLNLSDLLNKIILDFYLTTSGKLVITRNI